MAILVAGRDGSLLAPAALQLLTLEPDLLLQLFRLVLELFAGVLGRLLVLAMRRLLLLLCLLDLRLELGELRGELLAGIGDGLFLLRLRLRSRRGAGSQTMPSSSELAAALISRPRAGGTWPLPTASPTWARSAWACRCAAHSRPAARLAEI